MKGTGSNHDERFRKGNLRCYLKWIKHSADLQRNEPEWESMIRNKKKNLRTRESTYGDERVFVPARRFRKRQQKLHLHLHAIREGNVGE